MYSISSLQGSSGAPVLNRKGELVAINFAGIGSTQNFNYGIKVKYLRELLNK
jgi:S1-C subfamily serine protease